MFGRKKTITYRGGIVAFDIPSGWKEEYNPEGGGTFYEDRPESGTLRLNVLGFSNSSNQSANEMVSNLAQKEPYDRKTSSGLPMMRSLKTAEEEGVKLRLSRWMVLVPVPPSRARVVIFTHTCLASQEFDSKIRTELDLIEKAVISARFSSEPGVSGDFDQ